MNLLNEAIMAEYEDVLARLGFALDPGLVRVVLDHLASISIKAPALPTTPLLPDPEDTPFWEAAISSRAYALITGNKRHFPKSACQGLLVLSPKEFFAHLGKGPHLA